MFSTLYSSACLSALLSCYEAFSFAHHQNEEIYQNISRMFLTLSLDTESSADWHRRNILEHSRFWTHFKTNETCLTCLRRRPEHVLTCGHSICNVCIEIFGIATMGHECHYNIRYCLICIRGTLSISLKPPTAGPRILCIDGGGIRGVVPLEFLGLLQGILGADCAVQDCFDLAFGTSSGK